MPSARLRRRTLLPTAPLLAAAAIASCGGGAGGTHTEAGKPAYDADKLVAQSAAPNPAARSGRIDGMVTIALKGVPEFDEPFSSTISGPFSHRKGSALPDYELEVGVRDYGAELSSVGGRSYISLGTTGYELPPAIRARLKRTSASGANGLTRTLEQFGIAPDRWETDRRVVGTERIDGVEVVHIATSFNAGRILRDTNTLLELLTSLGITRATGLPPSIVRRARKVVVGGVTMKRGDTWIGVKDKVVRKSGFTMKFSIPKADRAKVSGISGGTVIGRLAVTEVGRAQRIEAPETLGRFAEFELALDALGEFADSR